MQYLAFTLSANFQFIRIVVDDVLNLCLHISDNLMVHTLCCCFHSSAYKTSIGIDKVYNLLVIFRILVAYPTTLYHLQSIWEKKDWFSGLGEDWRICRHILASMSSYLVGNDIIFSYICRWKPKNMPADKEKSSHWQVAKHQRQYFGRKFVIIS